MDELRDKVARAVSDDETPLAHDYFAADRILALPEIVEALDALTEHRVDAMSPGQFGAALKNG